MGVSCGSGEMRRERELGLFRDGFVAPLGGQLSESLLGVTEASTSSTLGIGGLPGTGLSPFNVLSSGSGSNNFLSSGLLLWFSGGAAVTLTLFAAVDRARRGVASPGVSVSGGTSGDESSRRRATSSLPEGARERLLLEEAAE